MSRERKRRHGTGVLLGALLVLAACSGRGGGPDGVPTDRGAPSPAMTASIPPISGLPVVAGASTIPMQLSPPEGMQFNTFPRTTTLTWQPVDGAESYKVEVDFCDPAGCGVSATRLVLVSVAATSYTFRFVGAQPGRWRVWAVFHSGVEGPKSGWRMFFYKV